MSIFTKNITFEYIRQYEWRRTGTCLWLSDFNYKSYDNYTEWY